MQTFKPWKKKLDISYTMLENEQQSAMQGEDAFQDTKLNIWKVDFDIVSVSKDLIDLEHEIQAIQRQLDEM